MFGRAELRLILLKLIAEQPRHGYDLIKAMEELSSGHYSPSPGVVYPALALLADEGLIAEQDSEDQRRKFAITGPGTAFGDDESEPPARLQDIDRDTILVVEVRNSGVHWMQPDDFRSDGQVWANLRK